MVGREFSPVVFKIAVLYSAPNRRPFNYRGGANFFLLSIHK
jgi:hypothetical protein